MWLKRLTIALGILRGSLVSCTTFADQTVMKSDESPFIRPQGALPNLADVLTLQTHASIYYSYARDTEISMQFVKENTDGLTIFVPTNKAVQALARKPNDDPHSDTSRLSGEEYQQRSNDRVRQWVGAHIIPTSHVDLTSTTPYKTLTPGITISFKSISQTHTPVDGDVNTQDGLPVDEDSPTWTKYVLNDGVKILDQKVASNGVIYIIDGTVEID